MTTKLEIDRMGPRKHLFLQALCLVLASQLTACEGEEAGPEDIGSISLMLTVAPVDARCLRITAVGARTVRRLFDLTPGQSSQILLAGVPTGPVTVTEEAFAQACDVVTNETPATWVSEIPVFALVQAGATTTVTSILRPTGNLRIDADFDRGAIATQPPNADFGAITIGATGTVTFTVTNVGQVTTGGITARIVGPQASDFSLSTPPCAPLARMQSCGVGVTFRPTEAGLRRAALTIETTPGGTTSAALIGVGLTPAALVATPADIDFGLVSPGASGGPIVVTVTNVGQSAAAGLASVLTGTSAGGLGFRLESDGCVGTTLPAGGRCMVAVRGTPSPLAPGTVQTGVARFTAMGGATASVTLRLTVR